MFITISTPPHIQTPTPPNTFSLQANTSKLTYEIDTLYKGPYHFLL